MLSQTTFIQPHHEHLKQLISLASADDPVARTLSNVGAQKGWWSQETSWTRTYGRYPAGLASYAILVYESKQIPKHICLVEIENDKPLETAPNTVAQVDLIGWITICQFMDSMLPCRKVSILH